MMSSESFSDFRKLLQSHRKKNDSPSFHRLLNIGAAYSNFIHEHVILKRSDLFTSLAVSCHIIHIQHNSKYVQNASLVEHFWMLTSHVSQWLQVIHYEESKSSNSSALRIKHFTANSFHTTEYYFHSLFILFTVQPAYF